MFNEIVNYKKTKKVQMSMACPVNGRSRLRALRSYVPEYCTGQLNIMSSYCG